MMEELNAKNRKKNVKNMKLINVVNILVEKGYYVQDLSSCKKDLEIDEKCQIITSGNCKTKTDNNPNL